MGNRRLLLNMYPNWLQSLVRVVLTGKYWQKMGSKISGALIGRIWLAKNVSPKEEGSQGA